MWTPASAVPRKNLAARMLALLVFGLALSGAVAACGGGSDGPGVATAGSGSAGASAAPSASLDNADRQRAFATCMRDNGVDLPDPDPGGSGLRLDLPGAGGEKFDAALEKCRHLLPNGGESRQLNPEEVERYRKFADCMREHGVDLPDPDPASGRVRIDGNLLGGIDPSSKSFKDAMQACQHLRPGGGS